MQMPLGGLFEVSWGAFLASQGAPGGASGRPSRLEVSWRRVGAIKKAWSAKGGLPGASRVLWGALGSVLGRSWRRSGALLDRLGGFLDAQRSPKGGPRGSQMALPRPLEQEISNLANSLIFIDFSIVFLDFLRSRGVHLEAQSAIKSSPEAILLV